MSIIKCKNCGVNLNVLVGKHTIRCTNCNKEQLVPVLTKANNQELYKKATELRINKKYDDAISLYNEILKTESEDADIYWSILLSIYGVEYVYISNTGDSEVIINRYIKESIFENKYYNLALDYSNKEQRDIIQKEAIIINDALKNSTGVNLNGFNDILDVMDFDDSDSKINVNESYNDILNKINNNDFVLEERNQKQYDRACRILDNASTKEECNEAYDIFCSLGDYKDSQALTFKALSKIKEVEEETLIVKKEEEYLNASEILKSANTIFECERAYDLFNKLDDYKDSKEQSFYAMAKIKDIKDNEEKLSKEKEYEDALTLLDKAITKEQCYNAFNIFNNLGDFKDSRDQADNCKTKISKLEVKKMEDEKNVKYIEAINIFNTATTAEDCMKAYSIFISLIDFKDSSSNANRCLIKRDEIIKQNEITKSNEVNYQKAVSILSTEKTEEKYLECYKILNILGDYKDSKEKLVLVNEKINKIKIEKSYEQTKVTYEKAIKDYEVSNTVEELEYVIATLSTLNSYLDSDEYIKLAKNRISEIKQKEVNHSKELIYNDCLKIINDSYSDLSIELSSIESVINRLQELTDFKDVNNLIYDLNKRCNNLKMEIKYKDLVSKLDKLNNADTKNKKNEYKILAGEFESIKEYKDSSRLIEEINMKLDDPKKAKEKKTKKGKAKFIIPTLMIGVILACGGAYLYSQGLLISKGQKIYEMYINNEIDKFTLNNMDKKDLYKVGNYALSISKLDDAKLMYDLCDDYKDATNKKNEIVKQQYYDLLEKKQFFSARRTLNELENITQVEKVKFDNDYYSKYGEYFYSTMNNIDKAIELYECVEDDVDLIRRKDELKEIKHQQLEKKLLDYKDAVKANNMVDIINTYNDLSLEYKEEYKDEYIKIIDDYSKKITKDDKTKLINIIELLTNNPEPGIPAYNDLITEIKYQYISLCDRNDIVNSYVTNKYLEQLHKISYKDINQRYNSITDLGLNVSIANYYYPQGIERRQHYNISSGVYNKVNKKTDNKHSLIIDYWVQKSYSVKGDTLLIELSAKGSNKKITFSRIINEDIISGWGYGIIAPHDLEILNSYPNEGEFSIKLSIIDRNTKKVSQSTSCNIEYFTKNWK